MPEAVALLGNDLGVYGWMTAGVAAFFLFEQYLNWHHCHRRSTRTARSGTSS